MENLQRWKKKEQEQQWVHKQFQKQKSFLSRYSVRVIVLNGIQCFLLNVLLFYLFPKSFIIFFYFLSKFREMNLIYCDSGNKSQRNVIEYSKEQHQINLLTQKKLSMLRATCELWMQAVAVIVAHCATHDWLFLPLIF